MRSHRTASAAEAVAAECPPGPGAGPERDALFFANYGLAISLARRYALRAGWGEPVDDLSQVALVGLINAVDRFDPSRGVPFSGFATATIVGELKHHLRDRSWTVRPPRRVQELYLRSQTCIQELTQVQGHAPTPEELAVELGEDVDAVVAALEVGSMRRPASLDAPAPGDDGRSTEARLPVGERGYDAVDERLSVAWLLRRLPERQRRMVCLRYIDGLTQNEIAQRMRMSQAHVQRLLVRSIDQLRALAVAS